MKVILISHRLNLNPLLGMRESMDIQRQLWWAGLHDIIQLQEGLWCTKSLRVLTPQDKKMQDLANSKPK